MAVESVKAVITFVIPGQRTEATRGGEPAIPIDVPAGLPGRVKESVQVGARRAGTERVRVAAHEGEDVVVLEIAGGPALVLNPLNARDLLLGQNEQADTRPKRGAADDGAPAPGPTEVLVPAELQWYGLEQAAPTRGSGFLGKALLKAVHVVTGLFAGKNASEWTARKIADRVDGGVDPGLYRLSPTSLSRLKGRPRIDAMPAPAAGKPVLVFLHGTFVDTASTFGKLWEHHPGQVRQLFAHYAEQVYALDHRTLGDSP